MYKQCTNIPHFCTFNYSILLLRSIDFAIFLSLPALAASSTEAVGLIFTAFVSIFVYYRRITCHFLQIFKQIIYASTDLLFYRKYTYSK